MDITTFCESPTDKNNEHKAYKNSFFIISPAPEYATGEVVLASLCRRLGYKKLSEGKVPSLGNKFAARVRIPPKKLIKRENQISGRAFQSVIEEILKSPKRPRQKKSRFLQMSPLISRLTQYTSTARLTKNTWNPGELVKRSLGFSGIDEDDIQKLWRTLFIALSTDEKDDLWARFIDEELEAWIPPGEGNDFKWTFHEYGDKYPLPITEAKELKIPASRFAEDLSAVMNLKESLTRRQWISILESIVRLGSASQVLWQCHVHKILWNKMLKILDGESFSRQNLVQELNTPPKGFWSYGDKVSQILNDRIREYYKARIGINLVLLMFEVNSQKIDDDMLSSIDNLSEFFELLEDSRGVIDIAELKLIHHDILDRQPKALACAKGIPSNIKEFLRHCLGQRETADEELKNYDQGYYLKKSGNYSAAPWIVSVGPISAISLVHCCVGADRFPKTVVDLCEHFSEYGIFINPEEVPGNELGGILRNLGLIVDSPDAEGGMVVSSPFKQI